MRFILVITLVLTAFTPLVFDDVFADSFNVSFDKDGYQTGDTLVISGQIIDFGMPVVAAVGSGSRNRDHGHGPEQLDHDLADDSPGRRRRRYAGAGIPFHGGGQRGDHDHGHVGRAGNG